jgi:hypothetical protein
MPQSATTPRPVAQSAVEWYKAKYPVDGAADIERWKADGEIVIVESTGDKNGSKN